MRQIVTSSSPVLPFSMLFKYCDIDRCAVDMVRAMRGGAGFSTSSCGEGSGKGQEREGYMR